MNAPGLPPESAPTTAVPLLAGRYQLLEPIGQGGMGQVFRARDVGLGRQVAVKVLPAGKLSDRDAVARFRREALALARLSHPNIVQAHDSGQDGEQHFLVMELVEGRSLAALLAEQGKVAATTAADVGHQAARALEHAHRSGLIHRDVKPSNLLRTADGTVKLLDLGLARFLQDQVGDASLTRAGAGMGTPDYCAPEQCRNAHTADLRADVYALGCTLYHLIAGRVPFPGSSLSEKMEAHERREPPPIEELCPEVPGGLALAVRRMMAKRPQDRFQSMAEVAEALAPYVAGSSLSFQEMRTTAMWDGSRLATVGFRGKRRSRSRLVLAFGAVLALLIAVGVASLGMRQGWFRGSEAAAGRDAADDQQSEDVKPTAETKAATKKAAGVVVDESGVLTVSRTPEGGGKYRSIGAALKEVKAGQTIRVLDDGLYRESLALNIPGRFAGMTLEAVNGATLETTTATSLIEIDGVANLTVRGFRLRATDVTAGEKGAVLVLVQGRCPGLVLERLEAETNRKGSYNGIVLNRSDNAAAGQPPALVHRCAFREARIGVVLAGSLRDLSTPELVGGVRIQENTIENPARAGMWLQGSLREVQVVGNRIWDAGEAGFVLVQLLPQTRRLLLANNTVFNSRASCVLQGDAARGENIQVRNNLFLASQGPDLTFVDLNRPSTPLRHRDGKELLKAWRMGHNWREGQPPTGTDALSLGWVPCTTKDVLRKSIEGVGRDPKASVNFLRPARSCPLATEGAGQEDPTLPSYVGAVPPAGVEPWDWDRACRMPKDAALLTVSKQDSGGGKYRRIRDALKDATPWATIRVLDDAVYDETLRLDDAKKHTGVTIEATRGATLRLVEPAMRLLTIRDVPHVCVRGFTFIDDGVANETSRAFAFVHGNVTGVVLKRLHLRPSNPMFGLCIQNASVAPGQPPLRVEGCVIRPPKSWSNDGIVISGSDSREPTRGILLRDNLLHGCHRGVVLTGLVRDVHTVGNLVVGCRLASLQVENLAPASRGLLFANNTAFNSGMCFRIWDDLPAPEHQAGQVELVNNLFFDAQGQDMTYTEVTRERQPRQGDVKALLKLWKFHHNRRDFSGTAPQFALPAAEADAKLHHADLLAVDVNDPTRTRPKKGSPLATQGAGARCGDLPAYIGALPPEGVEAWDWERTWRARRSR
jgi:hypothetical protein